MIHVGDKLLCIKDYNDGELLYTAGKYYIVDSVVSRYNDYEVILVSNNGLEYYFLMNDSDSNFYLYRYFSTIKDERKKKLKKIFNIFE